MRKLIFLTNFIIILSLIACRTDVNKGKKMQEINLNEIKNGLKSRNEVKREEPFIVRSFTPKKNGEPITKAACYGFYRKGQAPGKNGPSQEELLQDLEIIANYWNLIRIYNSDAYAEQILKLIKEKELPIKILLGVWLAKETNNDRIRSFNIKNTLKCIELVKEYPQIISGINVGNETQVYWSWHKMEKQNLICYIRTIRNNTSVPVTTADDYNFWNKEESITIANEMDFVVVHLHPLWNGKTLSNTFSWLDQNYENIKQIHSEKQIVIGEIGWATKYNPYKTGNGQQGTLVKGEVSIKAQGKFLTKLYEWIEKNDIVTFLFEVFDEPWKGDSAPNDIEKNWGVFYENRTPKKSFRQFILQSNEF